MEFPWKIFIDFGCIGLALLLATLIRSKVRFFQRYLIPNALTAGFILLPFYNFLAPPLNITTEGLGGLVYHLLSISFIAMTLRKTEGKGKPKGPGIFGTAVGIISQYAIQAMVGLLFTLLFMATIMPKLFPAFGMLLPLGFAQGPGQAFAIGQGWESFGFIGGGSIGLTFAAIGFLWACFGGVFLINYGIRKGWITKEALGAIKKKDVTSGIHPRGTDLPSGTRLTTESEAIDSLTYHLCFVLFTYFLSYMLLKGLTFLLSFAGDLGNDLAVNLWGISYIFAALLSLVMKKVISVLKVDHTLDNGTLTRISGTAVDLMVAASIGAISLVVVMEYWLPILVVSTVGGILALVTLPWLCSRMFKDHRLARTLIIYGASTGTMPTGLALLRVIDPDFETPVAADYMYSTAIIFVIVIPLILSINLPAYAYKTGNMLYFYLMLGVVAAYMVVVLIMFVVLARRRAFKQKRRVWLREEE
ncbi:MAG: sodium:glutamate symporter [Spirochaetales bacterium]|nr:sodium:glutamate symporter [Spirochaetales bacterium]